MSLPLRSPNADSVLRELKQLRQAIEEYTGPIKNSDIIPKVPDDPQVLLELFVLLGQSFRIGLDLDALDIEPDREIVDQLLAIEDVVRSYSHLVSREMMEDIVMYQMYQLEEGLHWVSEIYRPGILSTAVFCRKFADDFMSARDVLEQGATVLFFLEQVGRGEEAIGLAHKIRCFGRELESIRGDPLYNRFTEPADRSAAEAMS